MNKLELANTRTAMNLAAAFAGESMARNRYTFYAEVAGEEGLYAIEQIFLETAHNERAHAEIFYEYLSAGLNGKSLATPISVDIEKGTTVQNLYASAKGEHAESSDIYLKFAREAEEEGFKEIAVSFADIATVEARHCRRFTNLYERSEKNMLFQLPYAITWECGNCGYRMNGDTAPHKCPACHHPQGYFKAACKELVKIPE